MNMMKDIEVLCLHVEQVMDSREEQMRLWSEQLHSGIQNFARSYQLTLLANAVKKHLKKTHQLVGNIFSLLDTIEEKIPQDERGFLAPTPREYPLLTILKEHRRTYHRVSQQQQLAEAEADAASLASADTTTRKTSSVSLTLDSVLSERHQVVTSGVASASRGVGGEHHDYTHPPAIPSPAVPSPVVARPVTPPPAPDLPRTLSNVSTLSQTSPSARLAIMRSPSTMSSALSASSSAASIAQPVFATISSASSPSHASEELKRIAARKRPSHAAADGAGGNDDLENVE